ncbi:MAG: hydrogenase formation protein HypD [Desulfovibrionaceae bacterium]|nr:hydrogenase formation protein HypD [Desulfovibrionaceae bacterium]
MDFSASFQNPELCRALLARLEREMEAWGRPARFMEVCGTHTVSIFQSGLRSLLPPGLTHLSGPGCPVCVTHEAEVALFLELAGRDKTLLATFGDLVRVPGPDGRSLKHAQADGARVQIVYSPLDAVRLAGEHPGDSVVFLGVGFETTAPAVAGAVLSARRRGVTNFCVLSCHKLVPPVLRVLLEKDQGRSRSIDAFLLPGHVAVVLGLEPFRFVAESHGRPAVVAGFEPADILSALCLMLEQLRTGRPAAVNAYGRAVDAGGSPAALAVLNQVFRVCDARWRGLGLIPDSGLTLRDEFASFNAVERLGLSLPDTAPIPGCRCGQVLSGSITPDQCPLFGKSCTPRNPTGPCMVSSEGSCAAWYRYQGANPAPAR